MTTKPANAWHEAPSEALYNNVGNEVDRLYGLEDYGAAYDLLEATWPGVPDREMDPGMQDPLQFKAYLLARLGRAPETLDVVRAMHRVGYACGLSWSAFDALRGLDGYEEAARENDRLIAEAQRDARLEIDVVTPPTYDSSVPAPLAILLHGDGENMENLKGFWRPEAMLERGFVVAYLQSSQLVFTRKFAWLPDPAVAWKDVQTAHQQLVSDYTIDPSRLLLCGFSGGAITAVDLVFGEALPATGFISLCPEILPAHFDAASAARAADRGVRGVFIEGALVWPLDDEQTMVDVMKQAGVPLEILLNEGYGHAAPPDFDQKLRQALDFVLG